MGGLLSSAPAVEDDPEMLRLAQEYKVPLSDARNLCDYFRALDTKKEGFLTRQQPSLAMMKKNSINPLMGRVLDSLFYDPNDLTPDAKPENSLAMERLFAIRSLFQERIWWEYLSSLVRGHTSLQGLPQSGQDKPKRIMLLFRMLKHKDEDFINKLALEEVMEQLFFGADRKPGNHKRMLDQAFKETAAIAMREEIVQQERISFPDFVMVCDKFNIDSIFTEEFRSA